MIFQKGSGVPVLFVNPAEALLQTSRWGLGQRRRPSWWGRCGFAFARFGLEANVINSRGFFAGKRIGIAIEIEKI
jgi:hypothetical protein